ncbi:acyl-CoA dehydrogenase family protein [Xenophilus arseniciresistens]|uniref:Acyl-CoA dehydrogenase family protein n=1 Tax=Xenophilus arseniciresistens TaxID=1283306 RepID=A0AAE3NB17_9BURK|nr:acyl-CoA dehydrogenase family protein [Xenophilus arseniciresistens]MDA7417012.1 acyl-CoA dehydrogenase family protein [Xenophilus arseniciresistens]
MDWTLTEDERAFRDEVRAFLAQALTPELREAGRRCSGIFSDFAEGQAWHRILAARGWSVPHWPREHGGTGWSPMQQYLFARELAAADAPPRAPMGTHMVAPVIMAFGTPAQQQAWLPGIRSGEDYWCQGYSEPQAGSDLAALQCRAVRQGEGEDAHYVIDGTKIWTTHAHHANRMFCLVRTGQAAKPQQGISFLCFDMATPGITVRPIPSMSGDHELNQVFFDGVRVPVAGRIGEENQGWSVAKYLLQHERGAAWSPLLRRRLARLRAHAAQQRLVPQDAPRLAQAMAELDAAIDALEASERRALRAQARGEPPGAAPSLGKIAGSELRQRLTELQLEVAGPQAALALPLGDGDHTPLPVAEAAVFAMSAYLNDRAASIYAGTNEIQRNIVAAQLLAQPAPEAASADEPLPPDLGMLCDSLARYLRVHAPVPRTRQPAEGAATPAWWLGLESQLGLLIAARPEDEGGLGGGLATHMALMRVLGTALAGEPYLGRAVLVPALLQRLPSARAGALLQAAVAGQVRIALAHAEPDQPDGRSLAGTQLRPGAGSSGAAWQLSGHKSAVRGAHDATHLLVSAQTPDGPALLCLPADAPGLQRRVLPLRDGAMAAELCFEALPCTPDDLLGPPGTATAEAITQALDEATLAVCAEAIGVLTRLMGDTLDHVRQRRQFGAPIASFQAVQHRLADMQLALTQARDWVGALAQAPLHTPAQLARAASSGHLAVAHACRSVGQGAVQLHGGMGMTEELAVGHFFRRATLIAQQFGTPAWHARRLAALGPG